MNKTKKQSKTVIYVLAISLAFILMSLTGYAYYKKIGPFSAPSSTSASEQEKKKANNSDATNPQKKGDIPSSSNSKDIDTTKTTNDIPVSQTARISISNLSQDDNFVTYSASVESASTGTCNATFTNKIAKPVIRTTQASAGMCGPISIPNVEFSAIGTWTLTLRFYTNNTQAITTSEIEIH